MKIKDLKPSEYNPRSITDAKLDMLNKAMREFGRWTFREVDWPEYEI